MGAVARAIALSLTFTVPSCVSTAHVEPHPLFGSTVDIGGRKMHLSCAGEGSPTVIFEATGGSPSVVDLPVLRRTSQFTRSCVYDRAGLGWSDPAEPNRSFEERASDLHNMLNAAAIRPPYVLVGGSYGGLIARTYTREHPEDIVGMVLVDAAEEEHWFGMMDQSRNDSERQLLENAKLAESGEMRKLITSQLSGPSWLTDSEKQHLIDALSMPSHWQAAADEVTAYDRASPAMRKPCALGSLNDRPLVVLSHGKPFLGPNASIEIGWSEAQSRLAGLSTNSLHVIAKDNGHTIANENPDLVAGAVRAVVDAARTKKKLNAESMATIQNASASGTSAGAASATLGVCGR